jgi:hypothetical protein
VAAGRAGMRREEGRVVRNPWGSSARWVAPRVRSSLLPRFGGSRPSDERLAGRRRAALEALQLVNTVPWLLQGDG